ncbi:MAG TPA: CdaR family protein [Pyrinomonadaceae bacterium]|nr:CdaR family protein [Pyrinomonadaceae bacterium]
MAGKNQLFAKHILRKIFLEDWAMKLVALVITFGLWFGVTILSRGKQASERYSVKLNLRPADNAIVTNKSVEQVEIRVRGVDEKIEQIQSTNLAVNVDLSEFPIGDSILELTPESVSVQLPEGVKLVDLQPSRIAVSVDTFATKEIQVKAVLEGALPAGFEIYGEPLISPPTIPIQGSAKLVASVDQLQTEKISLEGRKQDFIARQIPVSVTNNKVTINNTVVDVSFKIGEKRIERTFSLASGSQTVVATLFGPRTLIAKLKAADINAEIVKNSDGADSATLTLPEEVRDSIEIKRTKIN